MSAAGERSTDLTARLVALMDEQGSVGRRGSIMEAVQWIDAAADRIEALEADNNRLRSYWAAHVDFGGDRHFVKPGQAVRPDGVVCDLMPDTGRWSLEETFDSIGKDGASHRYTSLRYTLRPVVDLPEGGTR